MRILYHHRTRAEDGQAVHIRALIEAFRAEGHAVREVALVPRAEAGEPAGREARTASRWDWLARAPRSLLELAEYGYTLPAQARLVRAARDFEPQLLYERYAFGNAAGVRASRKLSLPIVLEVNSPMALELARTRGLAFPRLARRVERSILQRASRVCVVTEVLGEMLVEIGVAAEAIVVTPNGVHLERYGAGDRDAARTELGLDGIEGPVLGFVGYYRDWHRLDLAIEGLADASLARAHLVLLGRGPAEEGLRQHAHRRGVAARVHFAGSRPHERVPELLCAFDVALLPAINPYASPLKLFEYMAAGLATVAPDQPNLREVLADGESGLLFPAGDGGALCAALARLVDDAELRARLGRRARATIEERDLTWRGNARRVLAAAEALS